jgi:hypothetical protein
MAADPRLVQRYGALAQAAMREAGIEASDVSLEGTRRFSAWKSAPLREAIYPWDDVA